MNQSQRDVFLNLFYFFSINSPYRCRLNASCKRTGLRAAAMRLIIGMLIGMMETPRRPLCSSIVQLLNERIELEYGVYSIFFTIYMAIYADTIFGKKEAENNLIRLTVEIWWSINDTLRTKKVQVRTSHSMTKTNICWIRENE